MEITRHFVRVGDREVHYRRAGSGPPFVLFHVSPQTSAFVMPQLLPLANSFTLIALDTPGYGDSDPLRNPAPVMADYADAVLETFDALGIKRAPVYGSHTGANVAVELARRAPGRISVVILDGLSLSTPEVAEDRTDHYAPRFTPTADGAHLAWAWQHTRDQLIFWPWYEAHQANRLRADMKDANYLHNVVLYKMLAPSYWLGYRAAFGHDSRDALKQLTVDTFFVTADADVHTSVERSLPDLPPNIHFVDTTEETQLEAIRTTLETVSGDDAMAPARPPPHRRALYRTYATISGGQRLVRRGGPDSGKPLVMLHGGMRTSALLAETAQKITPTRPVLVVDIAGNGDSDPITGADLKDFAEDVLHVLDDCGVADFDLYGESIGATLAMEVARQSNGRAGKLILDRPELPDPDMGADLIANVAPPIEARWDGTHFLTAWHMLRDAALFWPWYRSTAEGMRDIEPEVGPVALQARLLAWLKGRLTYGDYMRAAFNADPGSLLSSVTQPTLVIGLANDILELHARMAADGIESATLITHAFHRPPASAMAAFLGDTERNKHKAASAAHTGEKHR